MISQQSIPNLLTLTRIAAIPFLVVVFYLPLSWANEVATALFVVAAVTDWLDGFLARHWGITSRFGAFLDPVADKLMVVAVLILVVDQNPTPYSGYWLAVPAVVIVSREITISALREWMAEVGASGKVAVSYLGKIKTTAQMIALGFLLYGETLLGLPLAQLGLLILYIAALLTLWSMLGYLRAARGSLQ
ncbi:MAG: CDP-diacylglycerol--glycerol-3-phosphate 3-phosphatidyltransferase [Gammaproteobacteria bacterium]|nr:CDP-diacylglycerol--glycerol-3-phosphate 3-phosphatidyltransferase [Gammaproteobacteria bacterium]